ncbi:MAG: PKD domain-containing protein, partial [Gammaproteobacteria bacterium]
MTGWNASIRTSVVRNTAFIHLLCSCLLLLSGSVFAAKPTDPGGSGGGGGGKNKGPSCTITLPTENLLTINSGQLVTFEATAESGTAPYDVIWSLPGSDQTELQDSIATNGGSSSAAVSYLADGTWTATFSATDSKGQSCSDTRSVEVGSAPPPPPPTAANYSILAVNDLGMHCADLDYQVFSILPPFNVIHAQVIEKGTGDTPGTLPKILTNADVDVVYSATSSDLDPKGAGSINKISNSAKTNFWDSAGTTQIAGHPNTIGGLAYTTLYPSVLAGALLDPPTDLSGFCNTNEFPDGCPSILNVFEPLSYGVGLPVPDLHDLYPAEGSGKLVVAQQHMPGPGNAPQLFDRFDVDLPFFTSLPFGYTIFNANWFAADGIPILPIDDAGNENAYPLMRVQAISKDCDSPIGGHCDATNPDNILASVDIVLP